MIERNPNTKQYDPQDEEVIIKLSFKEIKERMKEFPEKRATRKGWDDEEITVNLDTIDEVGEFDTEQDDWYFV